MVEEANKNPFSGFLFTVGEKRMNVSGVLLIQHFLKTFSFPLLNGNPNTAWMKITALVITMIWRKNYTEMRANGKTILIDTQCPFCSKGSIERFAK